MATETDHAVTTVPITIEVKVKLQALAIPEAEGGYSIVVPALPGCFSQAETLDEVQDQIADAAEGWLAVAHDLAKDEAVRVMRDEGE